MKFKFQGPETKFNWHTPMFIDLCFVYGYSHATVAELSSCNRDQIAHNV